MSAFLVDKTTISKILTELGNSVSKSEQVKMKVAKEFLTDFNPQWQTQVGRKMLDLNQEALGYRYGDPKRSLKYTYNPVSCTKTEAFKALQRWLYQCTEGSIPEIAKLYQFFDTYPIKVWAKDIVMATEEYDAAEWG